MSSWIKSIGVFQDEDGTWKLVYKHKIPTHLGAGIYSDIVEYTLKNEEEANEIMKYLTNNSDKMVGIKKIKEDFKKNEERNKI